MASEIHFNKVAIIGVGLIGGSIALAMRKKGLCGTIAGVGRSIENLVDAKRLGIIDTFTQDVSIGVTDADLVIVAVPVLKTIDAVKQAAAHLKPGCIVTDAGSVKGAIVEQLEPLMPEGVFFVGAHPVAGTEQSGAAAAFAGLFEGHRCILTPTEDTDKEALATVRKLWQEAGATVTVMDAEVHDWILGVTSHLPHVIAYNLVNAVAEVGNRHKDILGYSAGGFKDSTRIASSSPEMWSEICGMNKNYILEGIEGFQKRLEAMKRLIQAGDLTGLKKEFTKAKEFRDTLNHKHHKPHAGPCNHNHD
ncbi:MAG: prephenate dehydrogenase/arogenate dehydrogenase family protein [Deltaproteobacteria bacterium]|nr:prephenate dehydrogenase/arogenate dehydrogenase family protein [Deltaproteobacteria bacterium]